MRLLYAEVTGFRAYKETTRVELAPGANCIVGLNGSGKSSLLEAVALVVSEVYGRKNTVDIRGLLHKGTRHSALSAHIELAFDNSQRQWSLCNSDVVVLKRVFTNIEGKKDQFLVNGKKVTKAEFAAVLEAGSFSKTNPYYVVRQGKIMEMAMMSDEGRLKLLKDFSGVQVYEEKRAASETAIRELEGKVDEINFVLNDFTNKLKLLEMQEKEFLNLKVLRKRRDLNRVGLKQVQLNELELQLKATKDHRRKIERELQNIESQLSASNARLEAANELRAKLGENNLQEELQDKKLRELRQICQEKRLMHKKVDDLLQEKNKQVELVKKKQQTVVSNIAKLNERLKSNNQKLDTVRKQRLEQETELAMLDAEYQILNDQNFASDSGAGKKKSPSSLISVVSEDALKIKIEQLKLECQKSEEEEEAWVEKKMKLENALKSERFDDQLYDKMMDRAKEELGLTNQRLLSARQHLGRLRSEANQSNKNYNDVETDLSQVIERAHRPPVWRGNRLALISSMNKNNQRFTGAQDLLMDCISKCDQLYKSDPRMNGDACVPHEFPSVLGPLWTLVDCAADWVPALSAAMSTSMENLVVKDDSIAAEICSLLKKEAARAQRVFTVNAVPLEQVSQRFKDPARYPSNVYIPDPSKEFSLNDLKQQKAVPLSSVVKCPSCLDPLIRQVLGMYLLVDSMETGRLYSQSSYDCVTVDGDRVGKKGSLQGGYRDRRFNLINLGMKLRERYRSGFALNEETKRLQIERQDLEMSVKQLEQDCNDRKAACAAKAEELREMKNQRQKMSAELEATSEMMFSHLMNRKKLKVELNALQQRLVIVSTAASGEGNGNAKSKNTGKNDTKSLAESKRNIKEIAQRLEKAKEESDYLSRKEQDYLNSRTVISAQLSEANANLEQLANEAVPASIKVSGMALDDVLGDVAGMERKEMELKQALVQNSEAVRKAQNDLDILKQDRLKIEKELAHEEAEIREMERKKELSDSRANDCKIKLVAANQKVEHLAHTQQIIAVQKQNEMACYGITSEDLEALIESPDVYGSDQSKMTSTAKMTSPARMTSPEKMANSRTTKSLAESRARIEKDLRELELELAKTHHVNHKALDDLLYYQREHELTLKDREQLYDSLIKVKQLMMALDRRRSATLRAAFNQVNAHLGNVFASIVRGGKAKLMVKKWSEEKVLEIRRARVSLHKWDPNMTPGISDSQSTERPDYEKDRAITEDLTPVTSTPSESQISQKRAWQLEVMDENLPSLSDDPEWDEIARGIELKASFKMIENENENDEQAKDREYYNIMALSGGQKTVLALCLIFAIQRCDKAPFYILDEVDAALDQNYRGSVAELIAESSSNSQFLVTTFRPELCEACVKHFKVTNQNRVASIESCTKQEAIDTIMQDAQTQNEDEVDE